MDVVITESVPKPHPGVQIWKEREISRHLLHLYQCLLLDDFLCLFSSKHVTCLQVVSLLGPTPELLSRTGAFPGFHDSLCASTTPVHLQITCCKSNILNVCADCDGYRVKLCSGISYHKTSTDMASYQPDASHNVSDKDIWKQTWCSSTGRNIFYHACARVLSVPSLC